MKDFSSHKSINIFFEGQRKNMRISGLSECLTPKKLSWKFMFIMNIENWEPWIGPTNKSCEEINHLAQSQSSRVKWDYVKKAGVKFFVDLFSGAQSAKLLRNWGFGGVFERPPNRVQGRSPGKIWRLALPETIGERILRSVIKRD